MAFDQRAYLRDVIMPLRDRPGGLSDTDLAKQYAVTLDMTAAELREHLPRVRRLWNQRSGGVDAAARVCAQLLSRDEQLRAEHGDAMLSPGWWHDRTVEHERAALARAERFAEDLAQAYGAVGRITRAQLEEIAGHWPGLSQRGVDDAIRRAGLAVVDAIELPATSGLERSAYRSLLRLQDQLGAPTAVQVVHPGTEPFRLLGPDAVPLDAATIRERAQEANRAADSAVVRARKEALGLLERAAGNGVDLRALALFQIVERVRDGRAKRLVDGLLVRVATDAGLELGDAQTVVANLPAAAAEPEASPAEKIRQLVADGQLFAARQALAVLPATDPDRDELAEQVAALFEQVDGLRRDADAAAKAEREDEAASLLRSALRIAGDDEDLAERLHTLAPPPPRDLTVRVQGAQVRLAWTAPAATAEMRYRVVRGEHPPRSTGDGDTVAEDTRTEVTDAAPPPGRNLHYSVFATAGGAWSRPVSAAVRVLPPVTAVQVWVRGDEVSCAWRPHPAAESVRVRRTLGRAPSSPDEGEPVPASRTGLTDAIAGDGRDRFYGIVAVYRDEHGAELAAPMAVAKAAIRDDAPAYVQKLRAHATAVDARTATAHVAWQTPAAGTVSVRRSDQRPPWPAGASVPREEMEGFGEPLIGDRLAQGGETLLEATVPSGNYFLTPFTIDVAAGSAVVGEAAVLGVTEPVRQLVARRTGNEATVAWEWPASVSLVEVTFTPAHGSATTRRLTRGQFAEAGCRIQVGSAGGRISVRALTRGYGSETFSAPASVTVDGVNATISYHLLRAGGTVNPFSRRRLLRVESDQPCDGVELRLVAAAGLAMPTRPEQGQLVEHVSGLALRPGVPWEAPFTLPSRLPKPYWLRCFVVRPSELRVIDPVDEMKVS